MGVFGLVILDMSLSPVVFDIIGVGGSTVELPADH